MHPPSNRFFYFSLFISIGVIAGAIRSAFRKKHIFKSLGTRLQRSPEAFGAEFFPEGRRQIAITVRKLLEKTLKMSLGGLQPDDSFQKELKFDEMSRETFQKFLIAVEGAFDIDLPPVEVCMRMTVGRMVAIVERKVHHKEHARENKND